MSRLARVVAVLGPAAAGKTSLTRLIGQRQGYDAFRLREHVRESSEATISDPMRPGWFDDYTALSSVHAYLEEMVRQGIVHTVLMDNFPGTSTQVGLFMSLVRQLAPTASVAAVELVAEDRVLWSRASARRVCQSCEQDPADDPHLPAVARYGESALCARCGQQLTQRVDDSFDAHLDRLRRYHNLADGVRSTFTLTGIRIAQLNGGDTLQAVERQFMFLLNSQESDRP